MSRSAPAKSAVFAEHLLVPERAPGALKTLPALKPHKARWSRCFPLSSKEIKAWRSYRNLPKVT